MHSTSRVTCSLSTSATLRATFMAGSSAALAFQGLQTANAVQ